MKKIWLIDECNDKDSLFDRLDELQDLGKISYKTSDGWSFSIEDLELTEKEEKSLISFFEDLDVYISDDEDEDDEDDWFPENDWN